jgi:hypothetical protein
VERESIRPGTCEKSSLPRMPVERGLLSGT